MANIRDVEDREYSCRCFWRAYAVLGIALHPWLAAVRKINLFDGEIIWRNWYKICRIEIGKSRMTHTRRRCVIFRISEWFRRLNFSVCLLFVFDVFVVENSSTIQSLGKKFLCVF